MITESFYIVTEIYMEECRSQLCVYDFHKRFCEGWDDVKDNEQC